MKYEVETKSGRDMAVAMSSMLNGFGDEEMKAFIVEMASDHRTLQQRFTGLCVMWINHLASLDDRNYDGRNESSVKLAKKFVAAVPNVWDRLLPFI